MISRIIFTSISLLMSCLLLAQEEKKAIDSTTDLLEITVTATRNRSALLSVPYAASTVSKSTIDAFQYRTTPEALTGTTGVFIQKTNHGGGSPFIRGLTGNQTLLLIDGIRLNNSTFRYGPNQYFNTIDAATISKIEVARGTGSVQYGSDALGGVVQVFTQDPSFEEKSRWGGRVKGKIATQGMEYSGRAEVQYHSKKLALLAGYSHKKFGDLVGGDTTGKQSPSGYKEQAFDVKLKYQVSANAVLTVSHQWVRQTDVPLFHRVKLENFAYYNFDPQQRQMSYAKLEVFGKNKWLQKATFITSLQQTLERRDYHKNGNANRFIEEDKVRTIGNVLDLFSAFSSNWTANSGMEYYHDKVNSFKRQIGIANNNSVMQRGLYPNDATNGNLSVYSLHHFSFGKFGVEAGVRYNSFNVKIPDTTTAVLKTGNVSVKPSSLVSNLALLYRIDQQQTLYSSFSTGYRAPNIDDMGTLGLVDFRFEVPAYNLKPEKTYNTEIGYRVSSKKIQSSVSLFYMHLSNIITRVQVPGQQVGGYNVYIKENSQRSFIRGGEVSVNYNFTNALSLQTNATYTYGQNLSAKEPMRRIPPFYGRMLMDYHFNKFSVQGEYLFAGKQGRLAKGDQDDNRIPKGGTPGWNILNFYSNYTFGKLKIYAAVQNIFDTDYRTHGSGINGVGRSGSLAVEISL